MAVLALVRPIGLLLTWFTVWPVLGTASFGLSPIADGLATTLTEAVLAVTGLGCAAAVAIGVRTDARQWRRRARVLGWVLVIDTVVYLTSAPVALVVWGGLAGLADDGLWFITPILVLNAPVLWIGSTIARRARSR